MKSLFLPRPVLNEKGGFQDALGLGVGPSLGAAFHHSTLEGALLKADKQAMETFMKLLPSGAENPEVSSPKFN